MVQRGTVLKVADNSGARMAKVIGIPGASRRRYATVGDVVVVAVQKALPNSGIKRHEVMKAVIARTHKEIRRKERGFDKIVSLAPEVL